MNLRNQSIVRFLVGCLAGLVAAACAAGDDAAQPGERRAGTDPATEWTVAAEPELQIGVVEGDPDYQFHTVVSAVRLPDGRIAVLNAGSHELRMYRPDGRLLRRTGRRGSGPGEFQRPLRIYLLADTIAVYDAGLFRLSLHGLDGQFLAVRDAPLKAGKFGLDEWLNDRSWIDGPPLGRGRAPVLAALSRLPPLDTTEAFRYVRVTPFGHLWVRQPLAPASPVRTWHVHDLDGSAVARVDVPAALEIYDFGADYLLGRARDSLDVEYIRLHRLDTRGAALDRYPFFRDTARANTPSDPATDATLTDMRAALRMLAARQEVYYSNPASGYRYADDHRKLEGYEEPEGLTIRIVNAHERGWTAVAIHRATGLMCGMAMGLTPPVGWSPGVVSCP